MLGGVFFVLFVTVYLFLKIFVYPPSGNTISYRNNNFYVFGLNIPAKLEFCGEPIPSNDIRIKKFLEKEFISDDYWKLHSKELFGKAQRWFPVIEPILKEEGVPDDFKYLAVIESHLSNVTSPAGASGFWQLVPTSAYNYGLEVSAQVDERYHVERSTRAACAHILDAYKVFNNWTLSAAAYNRGIGGIQSALQKQNTDNYFDLLLNSETASFVYRILAFKTLLSSPSHFGINKKHKGARGPAFKTYKIDSSVTDIANVARYLGCEADYIRDFNPWWIGSALSNPARKRYEIRLPANRKSDYSAYIFDLRCRMPKTALETETEKLQQDTVVATEKTILYVVKIDEPLKNLADFFKVSEQDLRLWNNMKDGQDAVKGQTLTIHYGAKKQN